LNTSIFDKDCEQEDILRVAEGEIYARFQLKEDIERGV
jgi:hypothetical protein